MCCVLCFPLSRATHPLWPHDVWALAEMGPQKAGGEVLPAPRRLAHRKQRSGWEHSLLTGYRSRPAHHCFLLIGSMFFIPFSVASNMWKKETSTSWPNKAGFCSWFDSVVLFTKWIKVALQVSVPSNNTQQGKMAWDVYQNKIISNTTFKMKKYCICIVYI